MEGMPLPFAIPGGEKRKTPNQRNIGLVTLGDRSRVAVVCMNWDAESSSSSSSYFPQSVFSALLDCRTCYTGTPQGVM